MEEAREPAGVYKIEAAKSSRSQCQACKEKIDKDDLRVGVLIGNPDYPDWWKWRHCNKQCMTARVVHNIVSAENLQGLDQLDEEDQELVHNIFAHAPAFRPPAPRKPRKKKGAAGGVAADDTADAEVDVAAAPAPAAGAQVAPQAAAAPGAGMLGLPIPGELNLPLLVQHLEFNPYLLAHFNSLQEQERWGFLAVVQAQLQGLSVMPPLTAPAVGAVLPDVVVAATAAAAAPTKQEQLPAAAVAAAAIKQYEVAAAAPIQQEAMAAAAAAAPTQQEAAMDGGVGAQSHKASKAPVRAATGVAGTQKNKAAPRRKKRGEDSDEEWVPGGEAKAARRKRRGTTSQ